jgi:hypothetical protein
VSASAHRFRIRRASVSADFAASALELSGVPGYGVRSPVLQVCGFPDFRIVIR